MASQKGWLQKEKRKLFCDKVGAYIIKTGSEKDPKLDVVFELAKKIVEKAFELFPSPEDEKEVGFNFDEPE